MQIARSKMDKWETPAQGKREQNNAHIYSWEIDKSSRRMKENLEQQVPEVQQTRKEEEARRTSKQWGAEDNNVEIARENKGKLKKKKNLKILHIIQIIIVY